MELVELRRYVEAYFDLRKTRVAQAQRGFDDLAEILKTEEDRLSRKITTGLRASIVGPWISERPGLGGVMTALIVSLIEDPWRFPGQPCTLGHLSPARFTIGDPCPFMSHEGEACPGTMTAPRPGSGVRSVWHWAGLHVVNGRMPKRQKGVKADWNPRIRTAILMPDFGWSAQIVRHSTPGYIEIYRAQKERLRNERGAVEGLDESGRASGRATDFGGADRRIASGRASGTPADLGADCWIAIDTFAGPILGGAEKYGAIDPHCGTPSTIGAESEIVIGRNAGPDPLAADLPNVIGCDVGGNNAEGADCRPVSEMAAGPLRPFQIEQRARLIAAKAALADMLVWWKGQTA